MYTDGSLGDGITYLKAIGGWCRGPGIVARQSPPFLLPQLPKHFKKLLLRLSLSSSRHNTRWIHISNKLNVSFYLPTSNSPIAKLGATQLEHLFWSIEWQRFCILVEITHWKYIKWMCCQILLMWVFTLTACWSAPASDAWPTCSWCQIFCRIGHNHACNFL